MEGKATGEENEAACQEKGQHRGLKISVISLFSSYFEGPLGESILGRAQKSGVLQMDVVDLRAYGEGGYRRVDDRPFGGGPGMVLTPGPVTRAIRDVRGADGYVVLLSAQGNRFEATCAKRLSEVGHLVLMCGHYEGVDQRVIEQEVDEELSVGDFVLTNGCLAALLVIDAVARFVPGVLAEGAVDQESFQGGLLEGPHYTRPVEFEGTVVPRLLRRGDHGHVAKWRYRESMKKTAAARPDLLATHFAADWQEVQADAGVVLWVEDLDRSLAFYTRVLGWETVRLTECKAALRAPGLAVILAAGKGDDDLPLHLWIAEARLDCERLMKWTKGCPTMRDESGAKRIEIGDPDGHVWSIGLR
jgi:tRNA (guanine37-N1)-methyltransferase